MSVWARLMQRMRGFLGSVVVVCQHALANVISSACVEINVNLNPVARVSSPLLAVARSPSSQLGSRLHVCTTVS